MSFLKFKSLVLFIKIVVKLLLLRPFGTVLSFFIERNWSTIESGGFSRLISLK